MSSLTIIIAPDPRLKVKCEPVASVDKAIRQLMDDMLNAMHGANGIGLAAPQVGVRKRVLVIDISKDDDKHGPMCLANPEIIWASDEKISVDEGCLSLPQHYAEVNRAAQVRLRYLDRDNKAHEMTADGLLARCIQHEIDHLDGILFVDHLSLLKRKIILRKLVKMKKQQADSNTCA